MVGSGANLAYNRPIAAKESSMSNTHSRLYANYVLFVLLLAYVLSFIDRNVMAILIGPIRENFDISDSQFGLLHGLAFAAFYTVVGIPIGRLADSRSRRVIITCGVFLWSLMTCACGLVKSFAGLFVARMAVGIGEAALSPPAHSLLSDYFDAERLPRAIAVYTLGITIGGGMAYMIGGWVYGFFAGQATIIVPLVGELRPWQLTFLTVGIPGFLVSVLAMTIREPVRTGVMSMRQIRESADTAALALNESSQAQLPLKPSMPEAIPFEEVLAYLKRYSRAYGSVFAAISLLSILGYAQMTWYVESIIRTFGVDRAVIGPQFGWVFIIAGSLGALAGSGFAGFLARRGVVDGNVRIIVFVALAWIVPGVLGPIMPSPEAALMMAAPSLFFLNGYAGVAIAGLQIVTPNQMRAQVSAMLLFFTNIAGMGFGPLAVGMLTDFVFGYDQALRYSLAILAGVICPLAAIVTLSGLAQYRSLLQLRTSAVV